MFELVKTNTKDNLYLHGLLRKGDKSRFAVLHIHGFEGDFFSNPFIHVIADALKDNSHTFLTVQTRGTANEYDLDKTDGSSEVYGSHYELLKEAYMDIDAWIELLVEKGYHNIVLQGHSLGTYKVARYLAEGNHTKYVKKLILLAPFDIHEDAKQATDGNYKEYLAIAKKMVGRGKGREIIPDKFGDVKISYQTMASWLTFDHFGKMFNFADPDNNFMLLNKIDIPVQVIVGDKDEYFHKANPDNPQEAIDTLKLNIKKFDYNLIEDCEHRFLGKEHEVSQSIILFLEK